MARTQAVKKLASAIEQPTIYFVGRNESAGARLEQELKAANPKGAYIFLAADVSKFRKVDEVCQQIRARENSLDLLFLTPGSIAFSKIGEHFRIPSFLPALF